MSSSGHPENDRGPSGSTGLTQGFARLVAPHRDLEGHHLVTVHELWRPDLLHNFRVLAQLRGAILSLHHLDSGELDRNVRPLLPVSDVARRIPAEHSCVEVVREPTFIFPALRDVDPELGTAGTNRTRRLFAGDDPWWKRHGLEFVPWRIHSSVWFSMSHKERDLDVRDDGIPSPLLSPSPPPSSEGHKMGTCSSGHRDPSLVTKSDLLDRIAFLGNLAKGYSWEPDTQLGLIHYLKTESAKSVNEKEREWGVKGLPGLFERHKDLVDDAIPRLKSRRYKRGPKQVANDEIAGRARPSSSASSTRIEMSKGEVPSGKASVGLADLLDASPRSPVASVPDPVSETPADMNGAGSSSSRGDSPGEVPPVCEFAPTGSRTALKAGPIDVSSVDKDRSPTKETVGRPAIDIDVPNLGESPEDTPRSIRPQSTTDHGAALALGPRDPLAAFTDHSTKAVASRQEDGAGSLSLRRRKSRSTSPRVGHKRRRSGRGEKEDGETALNELIRCRITDQPGVHKLPADFMKDWGSSPDQSTALRRSLCRWAHLSARSNTGAAMILAPLSNKSASFIVLNIIKVNIDFRHPDRKVIAEALRSRLDLICQLYVLRHPGEPEMEQQHNQKLCTNFSSQIQKLVRNPVPLFEIWQSCESTLAVYHTL